MVNEKREYELKVRRIEEGFYNNLRVVFECKFGGYNLEVGFKDYIYYIPGKKFKGIFEVSGDPDFLGEKDSWKNVCTVNYSLEKILDKGTVIWKLEDKEE